MKALVIAGGSVHAGLLQCELATADIVICADSGAERLAGSGRMPDLVIGDMDSISPLLLNQIGLSAGIEIIRAYAEKDETDAELALDEAIARGAGEVVLLGALGGRMDHALGNMMLLVRASKRNIRAVIKDEGCEIFAATGEVEIAGQLGGTVSLLPAGSGVSVRYLDGLKYGTKEPLPLPIDSPVGVSNVMTAEMAHVVIDGWAYIIRNI